jgi:hypothetical protein
LNEAISTPSASVYLTSNAPGHHAQAGGLLEFCATSTAPDAGKVVRLR